MTRREVIVVQSRRELLTAGAGLLLAGPAAAQAQDQAVAIPFSMDEGRPRAMVTVRDGTPPVLFLLDTGANAFVIKDTTARRLGLDPVDEAPSQNGATGPGAYMSPRIVLSGILPIKDVTLWAMGPAFPGDSQEGYIPALPRLVVQFDFVRNRLLFYGPAARPQAEFAMVRCLRGLSMAANEPDSRFVVQARLDGVPLKLLVDTGADGVVVLTERFVREKKLWDRYPRFIENKLVSVTGVSRSRNVRGQKLEIGGAGFESPSIVLADPVNGFDGQRSYDGVLGIEFLRRFDVLFDGPGHQVGFRPNANRNVPARNGYAGIDLVVRGEGVFIEVVRPDSPAERAGLRAGDRLIDYAGERGKSALDRKTGDPAGTVVPIRFERSGAVSSVDLVLTDPLGGPA